jgi:predicted Zn finger-like uncharacterized protein
VIIECTNCHARYQYDEDRFERKPSKKIKCAKCSTVFEIHNPAFVQKPAAGVPTDLTRNRREPEKAKETTTQSPMPSKDDKPHPTGNRAGEPQLPSGIRWPSSTETMRGTSTAWTSRG